MQRFTGKQYLQIDIANSFGLDKKDWSERLDWFAQHEDRLKEMVAQADDPAMFYAGVQAWEEVKAGLPIGYPISLDATSSGLQILAALTGDRSAAELCNVVNTGHRQDAYSRVYQRMLKTLGEGAKIKRDDTKRAIMTALYGSTAVPKEVFGEGMLLKVFIDTMQEVAPAAWELNEAFLDLWNPDATSNDWVLPDNFHVHVKVMAPTTETVHFFNEPVEITYEVNAPTKEGRSLGANTIHSIDGMIVREITRRCDYDARQVQMIWDIMAGTAEYRQPTQKLADENVRMVQTLWTHYEESGCLSARILDHLDSDTLCLVNWDVIQELMASLPKRPFKVIAVHDCFRCLPHYANDLREQYNRQLMLIGRSNLLQYLLSQITGGPLTIGKLDPNLWAEMLEADYALS